MCASCETYIGDLNENNQHLPYKYPLRDQPDKSYRVNSFIKYVEIDG